MRLIRKNIEFNNIEIDENENSKTLRFYLEKSLKIYVNYEKNHQKLIEYENLEGDMESYYADIDENIELNVYDNEKVLEYIFKTKDENEIKKSKNLINKLLI